MKDTRRTEHNSEYYKNLNLKKTKINCLDSNLCCMGQTERSLKPRINAQKKFEI